ncbi:hypothetical protein J6W20_00715 [bacterium]|nr:hypothetical protein [bacterium]
MTTDVLATKKKKKKKNVVASNQVAIHVIKYATVKNIVNVIATKKNVLVKFNTKKQVAVQLKKNALLAAQANANTNAMLVAKANVVLAAKKMKQKKLLSKHAVAQITFVKEHAAKLVKK